MRRRRGHRRADRLNRFQAGAIGIVVIILISYGAYTKFANPFASQFTIHTIVSNANGLVLNAPVRIAGVNVGKVTSIEKETGPNGQGEPGSVITMAIEDNGLPIHDDATFAIRPRIFLEGNFFVDLHPGSPQSPIVGDDHTFPIQQAVEPVQIDQFLTALPSDTRRNLQILLDQYGKAVDKSGASYNASIRFWLPAYKYSAIVAHDFLGIQPHDLSNYIGQMATVSGALDAHPQNLQNLITEFNTTAGSFARENAALQQAVANLPQALSAAIPAFNALNRAFPPLREFARTLDPGVRSSGPAIDASLPFLDQLRQLVQPAELRGLAHDLTPTIPALARLSKATIPLMANGVRPLSSCVVSIIYPWSQLTLDDHTLDNTPGFPARKAYIEAVDYLPGLAGESRVFDANGPYVRILGNGGTLTYSLQPGLFGQDLTSIAGEQPANPPGGNRPPLHNNIPCETQAPITNLNAPPGAPPQQISTDLKAPGAELRWQSALRATIAEVARTASWQGIKVGVSPALAKDMKLP